MALLGLVLDGRSIDCDAPSLFLGSLIDLPVFYVFRLSFLSQIFGDG